MHQIYHVNCIQLYNCIQKIFTASYIKKLSRRTCAGVATKDTPVMSFRLVGRERRLTIPEEGRQPMKFGPNIALDAQLPCSCLRC